jgi:hypothetical protein
VIVTSISAVLARLNTRSKEILVIVGLVVVAFTVAALLTARGRRKDASIAQARVQAGAASSTLPPMPSGLAPASSVTTAAPRSTAEAVVVHRVLHPAPSSSVGTTMERQAVDALHSGDLRRATELYRQLAAANPDNAALVETARLLSDATQR